MTWLEWGKLFLGVVTILAMGAAVTGILCGWTTSRDR